MEALDVERSLAEGEVGVQALMSFVRENAGKLQAHEAEKAIFKRILPIGLAAMKVYFAERGTGDVGVALKRTGQPILTREGGLRGCKYFSLFGKFDVPRTCYRTEGEPGVFPLDGQVNLPERSYSYFLQELMTVFEVEQPFRESSTLFEQLFDLNIAESVLIQVAREAHHNYDAFNEQTPVPQQVPEGKILPVSFDGKGVPMIKKEAVKLKARLGTGEKRQKKKEALVGVCYSVAPKQRSAEELAEELVEPEAARKRREESGEKREMPKAEDVRRMASIERTKEQVILAIKADAERRDPTHQAHLVLLLDGALGLWRLVCKHFREWAKVTYVLDIMHVVGYLWFAANALYAEGSKGGKVWVKQKLTEILLGRVGYVIGSLKQTMSKRRLSKAKKAVLTKVIKYFKNHRRWMHYDQHLAAGLPIATGVVESACGSLVKHRMEGNGKRWGIPGAEAILLLRSLKQSHNNDLQEYWKFRAHQEHDRLYAEQANYRPSPALRLVA